MAVHIDQVLDYLDETVVFQKAGDVYSLLEMIHDAYKMHNNVDGKEVQNLFLQVQNILDALSLEDADRIIKLTCQLCIEHEQLAFSQGILVGMLLMTEVNALP